MIARATDLTPVTNRMLYGEGWRPHQEGCSRQTRIHQVQEAQNHISGGRKEESISPGSSMQMLLWARTASEVRTKLSLPKEPRTS